MRLFKFLAPLLLSTAAAVAFGAAPAQAANYCDSLGNGSARLCFDTGTNKMLLCDYRLDGKTALVKWRPDGYGPYYERRAVDGGGCLPPFTPTGVKDGHLLEYVFCYGDSCVTRRVTA